jgi:hypothetical protein
VFYEYALIPDVFDPTLLYCDAVADQAVTELLRGAGHNGMIASLNKGKWREHVGTLVAAIERTEATPRPKSPRDTIQTCPELLDSRNRFVRHPVCPAAPASNKDWLDAARRSHGAIKLDGIVMCQDLYDSEGMAACQEAAPLDDVLNAPFWTGRKPDVTLMKRKGEFAAALRPVLRYAKKVTLIDPYIDPRVSRWRNIIDIVDRLTGQRGGIDPAGWQAQILVHAGDPQRSPNRPQSAKDRLLVWERELAKLSRRFRVTISLWSKDISGPNLHDRYIITNQCGVSCPGGLDSYDDGSTCSQAATTSTWSLMSQEATSTHLKEYEENSSPYTLLGSHTFTPTGS